MKSLAGAADRPRTRPDKAPAPRRAGSGARSSARVSNYFGASYSPVRLMRFHPKK